MIAPLMQLERLFRRSPSPLLVLLALGCQKENPEPIASSASAPTARTAQAPAPEAPSASAQAPAAETPLAGQDAKVGSYVETSAYKFRVDTIVRCADPLPSEKVPDDRRVRVAAKVAVLSKYDAFFLSGRDVTLEKNGVIIKSETLTKTAKECSPLLEQKRMNHDETAAGFVVFQIPDETFVQGGIVAFKPARWGGAPRTEIKLGADAVTGKSSPNAPGK
jgi:hypothetical protein